ncbi:flagellin N-methylase [Caballeronia arationis]|jgi:hypothetical protein|nr:flagellin N-methylase [Caballeronia arationis]
MQRNGLELEAGLLGRFSVEDVYGAPSRSKLPDIAVPLDPLLPDRLQHVVLTERSTDAGWFGAQCIRTAAGHEPFSSRAAKSSNRRLKRRPNVGAGRSPSSVRYGATARSTRSGATSRHAPRAREPARVGLAEPVGRPRPARSGPVVARARPTVHRPSDGTIAPQPRRSETSSIRSITRAGGSPRCRVMSTAGSCPRSRSVPSCTASLVAVEIVLGVEHLEGEPGGFILAHRP